MFRKGWSESRRLCIVCCFIVLSLLAILFLTGFRELGEGACGRTFCNLPAGLDALLNGGVRETTVLKTAHIENSSENGPALLDDGSQASIQSSLAFEETIEEEPAVNGGVADGESTSSSVLDTDGSDTKEDRDRKSGGEDGNEQFEAAEEEAHSIVSNVAESQPNDSGIPEGLPELVLLEEARMEGDRRETKGAKQSVATASKGKGQGDPSVAISIGGHRKHWESFSQNLEQAGAQAQATEAPEIFQELREPKPLPNRPLPECKPEQLVYVYDLPPEYNRGLFGLEGPFGPPCNKFYGHHPRDACKVYHPTFDGHGPQLSESESAKVVQLGSDPSLWADTGQFALEIMFHMYVEQYYPCRTWNHSEAAAFYVPAYMGLSLIYNWEAICISHDNCDIQTITSTDPNIRGTCEIKCSEPSYLRQFANGLLEEMNKLPYLNRRYGADHIITAARVMYDYTREWTCCTTRILLTEQLSNMMKMGWEAGDGTDRRYHITIPYPTCFHPTSRADLESQRTLIRTSKRTLLVSFAGKFERTGLARGASLRHILKEQCDCAGGECAKLECAMECQCSEVLDLQLHSQFCLQPPGDTHTRRSLFDSMQAGCIPVLFSEASAYTAYDVFLPPNGSSYSVFVPEADFQTGKVDIIELLRSIPQTTIDMMRDNIATLLPRISYSNHYGAAESPGPLIDVDAYRITMDEALWRIQDRQQHGY